MFELHKFYNYVEGKSILKLSQTNKKTNKTASVIFALLIFEQILSHVHILSEKYKLKGKDSNIFSLI